MAPVIGVVAGAAMHFLIQLPFAMKMGFRFRFIIKITDEVKKIGRLAAPRVLEISFLQISKMAELFFSSIISTASYTYYTLGNSLQLLPIGLFGTSIAKAALPTLSRDSGNINKFKKTLSQSLRDIIFLTLPVATMLIVLRIPIVRLIYGRDIFSWNATIETGLVMSAFAVGVVFQTSIALLARSFYALRDTKTPVAISIFSIFMTLLADYIFIKVFNLPVWGLAAAFSIGGFIQASLLMVMLRRKIGGIPDRTINISVTKSLLASLFSGSVMFFILKFFDRSVWVKQLSFLGNIEQVKNLPFEKFVLDTRYTPNLLLLTIIVALVGTLVYMLASILLKSKEAWRILGLLKRVLVKRKISLPLEEREPVSPTPTDTTHSD
jgi:putative peptidoglycan lipid II flippase